jgi:D-arabinose 5-phosphate isomerase GutQ
MADLSTADLLARARQVIAGEAQAVGALADQLDERLVQVVDLLLRCRGHVLVTGAGTSQAIARRFAHLLSCSGTPALAIDAGDGLHGGAGAITPDDLVFVISKGGQSAEINQLAQIARQRGATVVVQTEAPESPLGQMSDAVLPVRASAAVDPYGMIATGSSLVNAAAGDVLCVLLLELRGYSLADFGQTHPGGAVGQRLAQAEKRQP